MTQPQGTPDEPADRALIERWQAGDERAATLLVERHAPSLARFVASLGVNDDVEDVVQEAFIKGFASLERFRGDSSLRTWLCTIARNLVRDQARTLKLAGKREEVSEEDAATEHDALDELVAGELETVVAAAIDGLTKLQREVFTLRVAEGLSYREIARVVGSTEGAARVHYHNATRAIKERLNG